MISAQLWNSEATSRATARSCVGAEIVKEFPGVQAYCSRGRAYENGYVRGVLDALGT